MRALLAVLALAALTAGCGSIDEPFRAGRASDGITRSDSGRAPGQAVALIPGTNDYSPATCASPSRRRQPRPRDRSADGAILDCALSERETVSRKPLQSSSRSGCPASRRARTPPALYVAHVRVAAPGKYYVLARPIGKVAIGGIHDIVVRTARRLLPSATAPTHRARRRLRAPAVGPRRSRRVSSRPRTAPLLDRRISCCPRSFRRDVRDAALLREPHLRAGRRRRRARAASFCRLGNPLHPRRDLQGQRSASRAEPVGSANGGFRRSRGRSSSAVTAGSRRSSRARSRRESSRMRIRRSYARPQARRQLTQMAYARAKNMQGLMRIVSSMNEETLGARERARSRRSARRPSETIRRLIHDGRLTRCA